jgi:hypothetical protein
MSGEAGSVLGAKTGLVPALLGLVSGLYYPYIGSMPGRSGIPM